MNQFTEIQYAWAIYLVGSVGCTIAAWWLFLRAWRFVRYAAVITVMIILFTPFAIDPKTMDMAPAICTLIFEGMSKGKEAILPLIKVMLAMWLIGLILAAVFVFFSRKQTTQKSSNEPTQPPSFKGKVNTQQAGYQHQRFTPSVDQNMPKSSSRNLNLAENQARKELLSGEIPMRAVRD